MKTNIIKLLSAVLTVVILLGGCADKEQIPQQIIGQDYTDISFYNSPGEEMRFAIPFILTNKAEDIQFRGFKDFQKELTFSEIYFEKEYNGYYIYGAVLSFIMSEDSIYTDTMYIQIDNNVYECRFGRLYSNGMVTNIAEANDYYMVFNRQVATAPMAEFTENHFTLEAWHDVELLSVEFSSDRLKTEKSSIEGYLKQYSKGDETQIFVDYEDPGLMYYSFDTMVSCKDTKTGMLQNVYGMVRTSNDAILFSEAYIDSLIK